MIFSAAADAYNFMSVTATTCAILASQRAAQLSYYKIYEQEALLQTSGLALCLTVLQSKQIACNVESCVLASLKSN